MELSVALALITFICVGWIMASIPSLTRPDVYFAVTVQPSFRATGQGLAILSRYRRLVWTSTLLSAAIACAAFFAAADWLLVPAVLLLGSGFIDAFLTARRQTMPHAVPPHPAPPAEFASRHEPLPGGWLAVLAPTAVVLSAALYAWLNWSALPHDLPVHWGLRGPDRWVTRNQRHAILIVLLSLSLVWGMTLMAWGILRQARSVPLEDPAAAGERRFRMLSVTLLLAITFLISWIPWFTFAAASGAVMNSFGLILLGVVVVTLFLMIRMGQGGWRGQSGLSTLRHQGDRTAEQHWKLGLLYFNPGDPAILVEKRFGLGWTLNFGRPGAWLCLLLLVAIPLLATYFLR